MSDHWLSRALSKVWALERRWETGRPWWTRRLGDHRRYINPRRQKIDQARLALIGLSLRLRRRCPECGLANQVHKFDCARQGQPGRKLWSQDG